MSSTYNNSITNKLINKICDGRLTLESGVAISTTDQTAKTVVYFTPHNGNTIGLYDGSEWDLFSFSELSLSLSGYTANTNYDIFIYNNNGTLTLESAAWTNNTTRATNIVLQDGIYVKSGTVTRRYLGTIRTTGTTGQCEDSINTRFLWNLYNKTDKSLNTNYALDHTYNSLTSRAWGNNTTIGQARVQFVLGTNSEVHVGHTNLSRFLYVMVALDSTSDTSIPIDTYNESSTILISQSSYAYSSTSAGYHYLQAIEYSPSASARGFLIRLFTNIKG